jgi:hypothetical protein
MLLNRGYHGRTFYHLFLEYETMTPAQLRAWQSLLNLTQAQAAALLGMSLGGYKKLVLGISRIDRRTDLACAAIVAKVPRWSKAWE